MYDGYMQRCCSVSCHTAYIDINVFRRQQQLNKFLVSEAGCYMERSVAIVCLPVHVNDVTTNYLHATERVVQQDTTGNSKIFS